MIHSVKRWRNSGKRENTGYIMKALGILLRKFGMVQVLVKCRGFGTLIVSGFYPPDAISVHLFEVQKKLRDLLLMVIGAL